MSVKLWWFQEEGFYQEERRIWIPYRSSPAYFTNPGPINIWERPDKDYWTKKQNLLRLEIDWEQIRWPVLSMSLRLQYVEKSRTALDKFHSILWDLLEPLEGFDRRSVSMRFRVDNEFKVDRYGNVLGFDSPINSITGWSVDHIFPYSRGGLTEVDNLQIIQSRANSVVKGNNLEPLIKKETMLTGISKKQLEMDSKTLNTEELYTKLVTKKKTVQSEIEIANKKNKEYEYYQSMLCDTCKQKKAEYVCVHCKSSQYCSKSCAYSNCFICNILK